MPPTFTSLRRSRWRAVLFIGFVALIALINLRSRGPLPRPLPLLSIGRTTNSLGEYRLSGCERTLQIRRDQNGDIHTDIQSPRTTTYFVLFTRIPFRTITDTQREYGGVIPFGAKWFASVDECNNLWVCCGSADSSTPSVTVYGIRLLPPNGRPARGFEYVMATKNWAGVPRQFLDKIHADYDTDLVPTEPEVYTEEHKVLIAQLLNKPS